MRKKNKKITESKSIEIQALEPRFLLDGAAVATFADAAIAESVDYKLDSAIEVLPVVRQEVQTEVASEPAEILDNSATTYVSELVFIDRAVTELRNSDIEDLLNSIDSSIPVYFIDTSSDGVEQISAIVSQYAEIDAIHIISHGEQGQINIGSGVLDSKSMQTEYAEELASIGEALSEHGDILLYGCDFSAGDDGKAATALLSQLTGADIAASIDFTGAASKGGDWDLEHSVGVVQAQAIIATAFDGILIDTDGDGVDDADDIDADNDGIVDLNELGEQAGWDIISVAGTADITGTIDTGLTTADVTVSSTNGLFRNWNSGNYSDGSFDGLINIAEQSVGNGTYDVLISEGLTGFELFLNNWGNSGSADQVMIGNFSLTLDDGTVITNADFTIEDRKDGFPNFGSDSELLTPIDVGGIHYVTDPTANTSANQAYGMILFTDLLKTNGEIDLTKRVVGISFDTLGDAVGPSGYFGISNRQLVDSDGDGVADHFDLDTDDDGISDIFESGSVDGVAADTNGDGTISLAESAAATGGVADADGDGLMDIFDVDTADNTSVGSVGTIPVDRDGDGVEDYVDLDADNDGIPDAVEGQLTAGYVTNDGNVADNDSDGDGVIDLYDTNDTTTGDFGGTSASLNSPVDTDGDGVADFLDLDSDNDGTGDVFESGLPFSGVDANGDGIDDAINASYADPDGDVNDPTNDLTDVDTDTNDVDYRSLNDKDGDGVNDIDDLDDDNDGIVDAIENEILLTALPTDANILLGDNLLTFGDYESGIAKGIDDAFANTPDGTGPDEFGEYGVVTQTSDFSAWFNTTDSNGVGEPTDELFLVTDHLDDQAGPTYPSIFEQQITLEEGVTYSVGLWAINLTGSSLNNPPNLVMEIDGVAINLGPTPDIGIWNEQASRFVAASTGTVTIRVYSTTFDSTSGNNYGLDDIFVRSMSIDTDMDGTPDHCDLDSDNDGISDLVESGQDVSVVDLDGDGVVDGAVNADGIPLAANGGVGVDPIDSDGDGLDDYHDLDSDDDGIPDVVEGQPTVGYIPLSGMDSDGDGVDDAWDTTTGHGGDFVGPEDTDGNGVADYLDTDSDGDGISDTAESGLTLSGNDLDSDGIDDALNASYANPDGDAGDPINDLENTDSDATDVDYRSINLDPMDDVYTGIEDTPVALNPLANDDSNLDIVSMEIQNVPDSATEGELTYTDSTGNVVVVTPGAVLTPAEAATLVFTPIMDFAGPVPPINYVVTDTNGQTAAAMIDITITPTPDAVDDPFTSNEDTPVSVSPLGNDDDGAGIASVIVDTIPPAAEGVLTYTDASGVEIPVLSGTVLTAAEAATLTFTPKEDFNGPVTPIDYTLTDINGVTSEADILIDITPTPDAVDDPFVTNEDTPVNISPYGNDDDGAGIDSVTVDTIPPAAEGVLTYTDASGAEILVTPGTVLTAAEVATLTFTPEANFNGPVTPIDYTLTDINGATSEADILIDITPTPDAVDDPVTTNEDTSVNVSPFGNDDDGAGIDSVTVDTIPPAAEGVLIYTDASGVEIAVTPGTVLTAAEAATLTFTPEEDFNGPVTPIDYSLTDINGATSEADILIDITPTPDAVDDLFVTNEDTPVNVSPLGNDDDGAGVDSLTVDTIPPAAEGVLTYTDASGAEIPVTPGTVLTVAQAATLTFTPEEDFNGSVTPVVYTVMDINGATSEADILIDITPTPDAVDAPITTNEDTPVNVSPLGNDDDGAGVASVIVDTIPPVAEGVLTYTDASGAEIPVAPGTVLTAAEAATLTFTPEEDFNGPVTPIDYTLTDINGATSEADILIDITPTPDAVDDPVTTNEDTPVNVSPFGNDDNGAGIDSVTVDTIPPAAEGVLTYTDASGAEIPVTPGIVLTAAQAATLTFTPEEDFNGPVTPIDYTVMDINGATSEADILIDITPTPDAVDDPVTTNEDTPVNVSPLANDDDGVGIDSVTIDTIPPVTEGVLTYTDASGAEIPVTPGTVLTAAQATTLTFTPEADFNGPVTPIDYTLTGINGATSEAEILIDITPTPDAVDDPFTTNEETPVNISPFGNDDDGAGIDSVTVDTIPPAAEGVLTYTDASGAEIPVTPGTVLTAAEAATLTFTSSAGFNGSITPIEYALTDVNGAASSAEISVDVNATPVAMDETVTSAPDTPVVIDPLANGTDPDGDPLTITEINGVALTPGVAQTIPVPNGTVTIATDGTITVTPDAGFSGAIDVPYTIVDQDGATSSAIHTVEVDNSPPVVIDPDPTAGTPSIDPLDADKILLPAVDGTPITIDLDDYLTDPNGDPLTITPGTLPPGATFDPLTNEITFTPTVDNTGDTAIAFTVDDGNGGVITSTINIQSVNPSPVAVDETVITEPDTPLIIDPLANDNDADGDPLTITEINGVPLTPGIAQTIGVPNGTITVAADGTITVTPDIGYAGDINVPYTIVDQDGATDTAVHAVDVLNAPPQVVITDPAPGEPSIDPNDPDNIIAPAVDGEPITIDLDNYFVDTNGDVLVINVDSLPPGATFNSETNELTFTPSIDNNGDTVVPLTISNSAGNVITPTITMQPVNPAPIASPDSVTTNSDTPVVVDFLANDFDPDNDELTLSSTPELIDSASGTLRFEGTDWIFTPAPGFTGEAVIRYVVTDQDGTTATSTHMVIVTEVPQLGALTPTPELFLQQELPLREIDIFDYDEEVNLLSLDNDLIVLNMTEEISSLHGLDALFSHDLLVTKISGEVEGSEGFSSGKGYRGNVSVDPTDTCGRFFIDTIVNDEMLSVIARSTIDAQKSIGVIGFSATLANGEPLPSWVSEMADGEYLIYRIADVEVVALKLVAHRADGSSLIRVVEIDTLTGEIREQENATNYGASFSEELSLDENSFEATQTTPGSSI